MRQLLEKLNRGERIDAHETLEALRLVRSCSGYGNFDHSNRTLKRERIQPGREYHKSFPPQKYWKLYARQKGRCPGYGVPEHDLETPATKNEIDRKDPHATKGYNADRNLQLLCGDCNRRKAAKDFLQQSKMTSRPFTQLIGEEEHDPD